MLNDLQISIMVMVDGWVETHKDPVPLKLLLDNLEDTSQRTVRASVCSLCRKGYLRKSFGRGLSAYVKLRSL